MKNSFLFLSFLFLQTLLTAQVKVVKPLPFVLHSAELTDYTKAQIDAAFEALPATDAIRFTFLHKNERKKGAKYAYILTQKRAQAVSDYLISKQPKPDAVEMFVEPFKKPKNFEEASNLGYKKFASCDGVCSVIAHKPYKQLLRYSVNATNALLSKPANDACVLVASPTTIYGKEGTVIEFPDDAFVYENGIPIKCDSVCVKFWEFYSTQDVIAAGLTTTTDKNVLVSAGMVYIELSCNGLKLKLKPGKKAAVKLPTYLTDKKMQVFSGKRENGIIDWNVQPNDLVYSEKDDPDSNNIVDEDPEQSYFIMKVSKLGWINCDKFYEVKNKTNLLVKADTSSKNSVVIIFKNMKSVLPGYCYSNNVIEFKELPVGEEVTVLAYRVNEKTKRAVAGMQDMKLGGEKQVSLNMTEMSLDDFKASLSRF